MNKRNLTLLAVALGGATLSEADVLLNTFGANGIGYFASPGWDANSSLHMGKSFTVGSSFNLTGIDIALRMFGDSDQFNIHVRTDNGGHPGTSLEAMTATNNFGAGTAGVYNLVSASNPLLSAGTYFVTIEAVGDATAKWNLNNGGNQGSMEVSNDGGGSWLSFNDTFGAVRVHGTAAVPEPVSLIALSLGAAAMVRRRPRS